MSLYIKPPLATERHRNGVWKWSAKEIAFLRAHYSVMDQSKIVSGLHRSWKSITLRAWSLHLRRPRNWTKEQLRMLRERYPIEGASENLAKDIKHPRSSIQVTANKYGIHRKWICSICLTKPTSLGGKCDSCRPLWSTVYGHYHSIFRSARKQSMSYKNMPFFRDWNPDRGGNLILGARWILKNLGERPGPEYSLDIAKHEVGFVPGNLRWALRNEQAENKQHRRLGKISDTEFATEARRRGFFKRSV